MSKRPPHRATRPERPARPGKGGPRKPARPGAHGETDDSPRRAQATGGDGRDKPRSSGRPRPDARPASGGREGAEERPRGYGERGGPKGKPRPGRSSAPERGAAPGRPARAKAGGPPPKPWQGRSRDERQWKEGDPGSRRPFRKGERSNRFSLPNPANDGLVRLNKYLAQAGVGSRREADELISSGVVTVNGKVVTELGSKVGPQDVVHFGGQKLRMEQKRYVLLNKPKDTITTTDDPRERHTVMSLVAKACSERLYPVGRLDRNTTGVLLLTNDGDLAKKLTHPSHGAQKLYHATLDRSLTVEELHRLAEGVMLDDGPAKADEVSFVGTSKREVGLSIHIGRNRVVRRMFAALGAEVLKLDRVLFAGLTKKDLPRGHWRHLEEREVVWLRQMKDAPKSSKEERGGRRTRLSQGSE